MTISNDLKPKLYFPNLDGFRFLAFCFVYLEHGFYDCMQTISSDNIFYIILKTGIFNGGIGASFFFVLSGFLISYLILSEIKQKGSLNILYFHIRRSLRIWPLYFFVLGFSYLVYPFLKSIGGYEDKVIRSIDPTLYLSFLSNFQIIKNLATGITNALMVDITWAVAINEQFYIFCPLLFLSIKPRFYLTAFILLILISVGFKLYFFNNTVVLYYHTLSVLYELSLGMIIAYLSFNKESYIYFFKQLSGVKIKIIYFLGIVYLIVNGSQYFINDINIIVPIFFVFIISEQNFSKNSFYKMSANKLFSQLGKYSYDMYLLHPIAITLLLVVFKLMNVDVKSFWPLFITGVAGFIITMPLSYISYHLFEKQFMKFRKRFQIVEPNRFLNLK